MMYINRNYLLFPLHCKQHDFYTTEYIENLSVYKKKKKKKFFIRSDRDSNSRLCEILMLSSEKRASGHCTTRLWHTRYDKIYTAIHVPLSLTARTMVSWRKVSSACNVTFVVTFFGCNFISRPFIEKDLAYLDKNVKFEARLQSVCNMQVKFSVSYKR